MKDLLSFEWLSNALFSLFDLIEKKKGIHYKIVGFILFNLIAFLLLSGFAMYSGIFYAISISLGVDRGTWMLVISFIIPVGIAYWFHEDPRFWVILSILGIYFIIDVLSKY